jgi:hypothetical protein
MRTRFMPLFFYFFMLMSPPASGSVFFNPSRPPESGDRLFLFLRSVTSPESIELRMDELPDSDGKIRNLSLLVRGACFGGLRVEKIAAEISFLELNPSPEWRFGRRNSLKVSSALRTNAEVVILERDINVALSSFPSSRNRLSIDFLPGVIRLSSAYGSGWGKIPAETSFALEIRDGKRILMKDMLIRINGQDQTGVFREEIKKLYPLLDFENFPLPLSFSKLHVDDSAVRLSTRTPPKTVEGRTWRYERGDFPLPSPEPFDFLPEQFENGDIILVNGKSWRSKVLTFFFRHPGGYSHSGILRKAGGIPFVVHASPESDHVEMEPLEDFLSPFEIEKAAVYRLKGRKKDAERASREAWKYFLEETPFDGQFNKHDGHALYCTELIWKAYGSAGIDLFGEDRDSFLTPVPFYGNVLFPSGLSSSPLLEQVLLLE